MGEPTIESRREYFCHQSVTLSILSSKCNIKHFVPLKWVFLYFAPCQRLLLLLFLFPLILFFHCAYFPTSCKSFFYLYKPVYIIFIYSLYSFFFLDTYFPIIIKHFQIPFFFSFYFSSFFRFTYILFLNSVVFLPNF